MYKVIDFVLRQFLKQMAKKIGMGICAPKINKHIIFQDHQQKKTKEEQNQKDK